MPQQPHQSHLKQTAQAKINLFLHILGRRPDQYHELSSLVVFADLGDQLRLDVGLPVGISLSGPFAATLAEQTPTNANLIDKTLTLLNNRHPQLQLGHITLTKHLPVAAGIGGGSADAAATLRLIATANPLLAAAIDWAAIALELGADVPICLHSAPAYMSGIGQIITPLNSFPALSAVLVKPQVIMPHDKTRQIFAILQAPALPNPSPATKALQTVIPNARTAIDMLQAASNDLTAACTKLAPDLQDVLSSLTDSHGCRLARLSGAGPSCFGLFDDHQGAHNAAKAIIAEHPDWWVKPVQLGGTPASCPGKQKADYD